MSAGLSCFPPSLSARSIPGLAIYHWRRWSWCFRGCHGGRQLTCKHVNKVIADNAQWTLMGMNGDWEVSSRIFLLCIQLISPNFGSNFGPQYLRKGFNWCSTMLLSSCCLTISHEHCGSEFLPPCLSSVPPLPHLTTPCFRSTPLQKLLEICVWEKPQIALYYNGCQWRHRGLGLHLGFASY